MATVQSAPGPWDWVLLNYRLPREPSTPRIAVWRQLRRLGAAQLSDGLVTLPADARTREQLDWVAATVAEARGTAGVWLARPASLAQERDLAAAMAAARATEYQSLRDQAKTAAGLPAAERARVARRLRDQLRDQLRGIRRRDFFPPPQRAAAVAVVNALVAGDPAFQAAGPVRGHSGSRQ